MARPAYERVGAAFRGAYEAAGLRQTDIAEALGVDPATVSKWSRGLQRIDLEYFPEIDRLCGKPKGYVLRLAGYIEDDPAIGVRSAIMADHGLTEQAKLTLLDVYESFQKRAAAQAGSSEHTIEEIGEQLRDNRRKRLKVPSEDRPHRPRDARPSKPA